MDDAENAADDYGDFEAEEDPTDQEDPTDGEDPTDEAALPGGDGMTEEDAVDQGPTDVFLDVPLLNIEEINLEVEDLSARVSLRAEVLDLLRLQVGADVELGKVELDIKGVQAQAQLKVRLGNVAAIVNRVLTTIDRNPQILEQLTRGVGTAVEEVGAGTRHAVGELGRGTGRAVEDVGRGAGGAVEHVGRGAGEAVEEVGHGAGGAVEDVGRGAGGAVEGVGRGAGEAVEEVGRGAGGAVEGVGRGAGETVEGVGAGVEDTVGEVGDTAGEAVEEVEPGQAVEGVGKSTGTGTAKKRGRREVRAPEVRTRRNEDIEARSARTARRRTAHRRDRPD
ncbi:hypothetical protein ACFYYH_19315 [Streptomyces sp. NPDC002018]|uniref:hypothetical protein n=1 Tax=Streptomyces sp. NPDC002018 TaxID=3364629 RepID=UPI0036A3B1FB